MLMLACFHHLTVQLSVGLSAGQSVRVLRLSLGGNRPSSLLCRVPRLSPVRRTENVQREEQRTGVSGQEKFSLLSPEEIQGLSLPLLALVDPPQAQNIEQDGEQHHQDAEGEKVVVVDEGRAQPAGVSLTHRVLPQIPADDRWSQRMF